MCSILFLQAIDPTLLTPLLWLAIFAVGYFLLIRPNIKKQKQQQVFQQEISKGDEVVTASGIIGRINKIEEKEVTLDLGNKTFIRVTRNSISMEMTEAFKGKGDDKS